MRMELSKIPLVITPPLLGRIRPPHHSLAEYFGSLDRVIGQIGPILPNAQRRMRGGRLGLRRGGSRVDQFLELGLNPGQFRSA